MHDSTQQEIAKAIVAAGVGALGGVVGKVYRRAIGPFDVDPIGVAVSAGVSAACSGVFAYAASARFDGPDVIGLAFVVGILAVPIVEGIKAIDVNRIIGQWLKK